MKKTIALLITLSIITTIGLAACVSKTEATPLENTPWVLESYGEQGSPKAVIEGSEITALFDSDEGKVKGSAGCNSYFAGYEVSGNQLSVSDAGSTMMECEGIMEQEYQYLALLQGAQTFQIEGSQLKINSSGNQVLVFSASP